MNQAQKRLAVRLEDVVSRQFLPAHENHETQAREIENSQQSIGNPVPAESFDSLRSLRMAGFSKWQPLANNARGPFWK